MTDTDSVETPTEGGTVGYTNGHGPPVSLSERLLLIDTRQTQTLADVTRVARAVEAIGTKVSALEVTVQSHAAKLTTQGVLVTVGVVIADLLWRAATGGHALPGVEGAMGGTAGY